MEEERGRRGGGGGGRGVKRYHGDVAEGLNDLSDLPHLLLYVTRPDLADNLTRICKCSRHSRRLRRGLKTPTILQH